MKLKDFLKCPKFIIVNKNDEVIGVVGAPWVNRNEGDYPFPADALNKIEIWSSQEEANECCKGLNEHLNENQPYVVLELRDCSSHLWASWEKD